MIMTLGASPLAFLITLDMTVPTPTKISGMTSAGTTIIEMRVRRSRSESLSSFSQMVRMLCQFMRVGLRC